MGRSTIGRAGFGFFALMVAAALAACGGGGGGGGGTGGGGVLPTTAPTASTTPAVAPTSQSAQATSSTSATTSLNLGGVSINGTNVVTSSSVTVPITSVATQVSITEQASLPSGSTVPQAHMRPQSLCSNCTVTPLVYLTLSVNPTTTITQSPAVTVTIPSNVTITSGNAYLVVYENGTWNEVAGPLAASNSMTFTSAGISPSPFTLTSGANYVFAVVTTGTATVATPTASPTSSPTSGPSSAPAGTYFYVPSYKSSNSSWSVSAYAFSASGSTHETYEIDDAVYLGTSAGGIDALAADAQGNLYVAISDLTGSNHILVYAPHASGSVQPTRTIYGSNSMLGSWDNEIVSLAVGADGTIYAGMATAAGNPSVLEFAPGASGNVAPIRTITASTTNGSSAVAAMANALTLDSSGNLVLALTPAWSLSALGEVQSFAAGASGSATPTNTFQFNCNGIAAGGGTAYCLNTIATNGIYSVSEAAPGPTPSPATSITGSSTGLTNPLALALSGSNLYAYDLGTSGAHDSILVFSTSANGNVAPSSTITLLDSSYTLGGAGAADIITIGTQP